MKRALTALFLPIFASFLILGCDGTGTAPNASTDAEPDRASEVENLTGKDLYRGFLTGEGQVAEMFPEVFDTPEALNEQTLKVADRQLESMGREEIREAYQKARQRDPEERRQDAKSFASKLIDRVEQENPDFFATFERKMKSGDPMMVREGLALMSEVTTPAMANVLDVSEKILHGAMQPGTEASQDKFIAVIVVAVVTGAAVFNVAAVVNGAVTVNVAVNVNGAYNINVVANRGFSRTAGKGDLDQEMLVGRVAKRLAS